MKRTQLTQWMDEDKKMDTEYGLVSVRYWCEREAKRIGRCKVSDRKIGEITQCCVEKLRGETEKT